MSGTKLECMQNTNLWVFSSIIPSTLQKLLGHDTWIMHSCIRASSALHHCITTAGIKPMQLMWLNWALPCLSAVMWRKEAHCPRLVFALACLLTQSHRCEVEWVIVCCEMPVQLGLPSFPVSQLWGGGRTYALQFSWALPFSALSKGMHPVRCHSSVCATVVFKLQAASFPPL